MKWWERATVESSARAEREKTMQVIAAEADAAKQTIAAAAAAAAALKEAEAIVTMARATAQRGIADAEARRKLVEAENTLALKFVLRDVVLHAIDRAPEVARELMAPAKAIREIRVLQTGGLGGGTAGAPALGAMSPILKSVLEAGAAYPLLRELMQFAGADGLKAGETVHAALDELSCEIGKVLKAEEPIGSNGGAGPASAAGAVSQGGD